MTTYLATTAKNEACVMLLIAETYIKLPLCLTYWKYVFTSFTEVFPFFDVN